MKGLQTIEVTAADMLLTAYARGAANGGSTNWEDVDLAFAYAKQENPGRYEAILDSFRKEEVVTKPVEEGDPSPDQE